MLRDIAATRLIEVFCRQEDALAVIWEIQNIEKTEVKADAVQVNKQTEHTGTYKVRGHFAGIPWHNEFAYVLHEQGFHSTEAHPPAFKEGLWQWPLESRVARSSTTNSMSCHNGLCR